MTTIQNPATPTGGDSTGEPETGFADDWQRWHTERETALAIEHGWLSLTAFHWLPSAPQALDGLAGRWSADGQQAVLTGELSDGLTVLPTAPHGTVVPVDGTVTAEVPEAGSRNWIGLGDAVIELVLRGGRYAIRVRDPLAPTRTAFTGVPAFEPDPEWVRPARFSALGTPRPVTVGTARGDLRQQITVVGTVTVQLPGGEQELVAVGGGTGALQILFHDATNGSATAPWRTVGTSVPDPDGSVTVDFNRAVNLPFAFTDFGTCPAPPDGNRIADAVTAGEKKPRQATTDRTAQTRS